METTKPKIHIGVLGLDWFVHDLLLGSYNENIHGVYSERATHIPSVSLAEKVLD